jgi:hypothetical protein
MDGAFGAEPEAVLGQSDMSRIPAVEILADSLRYARADSLPQCIAQIEVFPGHTKWHGNLFSK